MTDGCRHWGFMWHKSLSTEGVVLCGSYVSCLHDEWTCGHLLESVCLFSDRFGLIYDVVWHH